MTETTEDAPPVAYCPSCGHQVGPHDAFCSSCGHPLPQGAPAQQADPAPQPSPRPMVAPITPSNPTGAVLNTTAHEPTHVGMAILWFLICMPIGYSSFGQPAKGWLGLLAVIVLGTVGIGALLAPAMWVDYWFCFARQEKRPLGEWEFFPTK